MVPNPGVLTGRRQFLKSLLAPAIANQSKRSIKPQTPLPGISEPEFWFGEQVQFKFFDESGEPQSEWGEVVGVVWNSPEFRWEYQVTWLGSTVCPIDGYPISDGSLWTADVFHKSRSNKK